MNWFCATTTGRDVCTYLYNALKAPETNADSRLKLGDLEWGVYNNEPILTNLGERAVSLMGNFHNGEESWAALKCLAPHQQIDPSDYLYFYRDGLFSATPCDIQTHESNHNNQQKQFVATLKYIHADVPRMVAPDVKLVMRMEAGKWIFEFSITNHQTRWAMEHAPWTATIHTTDHYDAFISFKGQLNSHENTELALPSGLKYMNGLRIVSIKLTVPVSYYEAAIHC